LPSSSVSMWYTWNSFHTLSRSVCEGRSSARSGVGIQVPPRDTQLAPWMERRGAYLREVGHFLHDLELLGRQAPLERAAALPAAAAAMRRERSAKSRGACEARQRAREAAPRALGLDVGDETVLWDGRAAKPYHLFAPLDSTSRSCSLMVPTEPARRGRLPRAGRPVHSHQRLAGSFHLGSVIMSL
jgi:hypothetical protein